MGKHESFNTSKRKFQKIWERNKSNTSEIKNDLNKFTLNFNSVNFHKKKAEITLVNNLSITTFQEIISTLYLENFPEWIINHINVNSFLSTTSGFQSRNIIDSGAELSSAQIGDLLFTGTNHFWIVKRDGNNYDLKVFNTAFLQVITSLTPSIEFSPVPIFLTIKVTIINPRIYENNREKKE